jgi:hypothetical protein
MADDAERRTGQEIGAKSGHDKDRDTILHAKLKTVH